MEEESGRLGYISDFVEGRSINWVDREDRRFVEMDGEGEYFRNGRQVREPVRSLGELDMLDERETDSFFACLMRND
jgi:hypothetical protein